MSTTLDHIYRNARIAGREQQLVDIGVKEGRFAVIAPAVASDAPAEDLGGRLVVPGLVETHLHLDKSCILDRCALETGTFAEAITTVAAAKRAFTEADVYARASHTLEKAILQGTQHIRTHVEVDPRIGLTSLHALLRLKRDCAWGLDLKLCAFPQEGLLDDPGAEDVLVAALQAGAEVVGGAPYMDKDSHRQIARIFGLAQRFDVDVDLHLDFSLDTSHLDLLEVCRLTEATGWGGRVAIGHVSKLSALPPARLAELARRMADAGVALTVLPATDLYMMGREHAHNVPRGVPLAHRLAAEHGVTCSLSTNNVLNPFTPFGDCSLVRMSNLYANIAQVGTPAGLETCLDMITTAAAKLLNLKGYGIAVGHAADMVVLDSTSRAMAVAELAQPLLGVKGGRRTFTRPTPILHRQGTLE